MSCEFCETIALAKELDKQFPDERFRDKYYVRLCVTSQRRSQLTDKWTEAGETTYRKMKLNFCPECGKKINYHGE